MREYVRRLGFDWGPQAILDAARGPRLAGIDGKVALFFGCHLAALAIAFSCRTDLSNALHGMASQCVISLLPICCFL
jgi:hypothetical protein